MAKKNTKATDEQKLKAAAEQSALEEKVRIMLDPEVKDAEPEAAEIAAESISSAPELKEINAALAKAVGDKAGEVKTMPADETPSPATSESPKPEPAVDDDLPADPETDKAVDDIVAKESDELLSAEDAKISKTENTKKPGHLDKFKQAWKDWWQDPAKRRVSIITLVVLIVGLLVVPYSRYFILNTAGVHSSASLVVLDDSSQQPLKNVEVSLGNQSGQTDKDGRLSLHHLRLGKQQLVIKKRAFASLQKDVTLGWGSNPLGDQSLTPSGTQYSFKLTDYLSEKPIVDAEATSGDASAVADDDGVIKLTIEPKNDEAKVEVAITAAGYRTETLTIDADTKEETKLTMAPSQSHVFISKRSGKYDVYKIDADGKNEKVILAGTGNERDDMVLVPHPTQALAALVSTRDNTRNKDGFLLSSLTLIDTSDGTSLKIATSERIQIIDWTEDRLVFVQIAAGASASDAKRHRLMSYSVQSQQTKELAATNYFNDVIAIGSAVYYAPSSAYATEKAAFYKIGVDGNGKQTVFTSEVWNVFRTEYDKLVLAVGQDWFDYGLSDNKAIKLGGQPANLLSRVYADSPDHKHSLWVDQRDGKGVLLSYGLNDKSDKTLHEQSGLVNPANWLSNSAVVFRVRTSQETADYVISLDGGKARKLKDVTNTAGIDRWYYY